MDEPKPMPQDTTVAVQAVAPSPTAATPLATSGPILTIPHDLPSTAFEAICTEIVREQAGIISRRLATEQLQTIQGLTIDPQTLRCSIAGDGNKVINDVVNSFSQFFGSAAVEVCREVADRYLLKLPTQKPPVAAVPIPQ